MSLAAPWVLAFLVVAVGVVVVDAMRPWPAGTVAKAAAIAVRAAILCLLVLGLAQPSIPWSSGSPTPVVCWGARWVPWARRSQPTRKTPSSPHR